MSNAIIVEGETSVLLSGHLSNSFVCLIKILITQHDHFTGLNVTLKSVVLFGKKKKKECAKVLRNF